MHTHLSQEARSLLRRHLAGDQEVTPSNRPAYRELAEAGVMIPLNSFVRGNEALYKFTDEGWERRLELIGSLPGESLSPLRRCAAGLLARLATRLREFGQPCKVGLALLIEMALQGKPYPTLVI